jgi:hypothetical protein
VTPRKQLHLFPEGRDEVGATLWFDMVAHQSIPVRLQTVPANQKSSPESRLQCLQKLQRQGRDCGKARIIDVQGFVS